MCRIIPMAWFWTLITSFMKIFACGGLTIPFKAWNLMKKCTVKNSDCRRRKFLGGQEGITPLWFEKFTPPPLERKPHTPLGFLTLSTCDCFELGYVPEWAFLLFPSWRFQGFPSCTPRSYSPPLEWPLGAWIHQSLQAGLNQSPDTWIETFLIKTCSHKRF